MILKNDVNDYANMVTIYAFFVGELNNFLLRVHALTGFDTIFALAKYY